MIPRLSDLNKTQKLYLDFIQSLKEQGFSGDLSPDYATRVVLATDNSIYQVLPQGIVFPRSVEDLVLIAQLADQSAFHGVVLSPRGGGTGTNGQSLSDGLLVDVSRHMNTVLEINASERWVRVQGGVVKDQLNRALKPYGLFFAPELSTSNRATIGGMINTDASGQGSCLYGKTRDHVLALKSVLLDGSVWDTQAQDAGERATGRAGKIQQLLVDVHAEHAALIEERFPKLNRCLTGYDLAHVYEDDGRLNPNSVLCGSEGTLAFIAEAKLNVLPIPKCVALVNVCYNSFDDALRDAQDLMKASPSSIETVDSRVLGLAQADIVWDSVADFFPATDGQAIQGINLVEYTAEDEATLKRNVQALCDQLDGQTGQANKNFAYKCVWGAGSVNKIWGMRKKAVGLLGNAKGERRPIPFVEDTCVPPENLADFIAEFRALLDANDLQYGMFGHVDAGVLHVRPAIDMKDETQEKMIRKITDEVVVLVTKYKGLLWGEHGKGMRSEYAPELFGPELYTQMRRVKAAFDPRNQLNPGKICTPLDQDVELIKIDEVSTRGQFDRQISDDSRLYYDAAMYCNGNGACYNYDPNDAMCPSWKQSRDRRQSPKGRSSLIREWLRLIESQGQKLGQKVQEKGSLYQRWQNTRAIKRGEYDFSNEVHESMMSCLACKSCASQCPIKVNVPEFRAKFLSAYYGRYLRPAKDYMVAALEFMIPTLARFPQPYNWAMTNTWMQKIMASSLGMVDSPSICRNSLRKGLKTRGMDFVTAADIAQLDEAEKASTVVIVQDAFTSYFESALVLDFIDFLQALEINVQVAPFSPNGKPMHVHGFLDAFEASAKKSAKGLKQINAQGVALVGVDPSMTLTYRQEYKDLLGEDAPEVLLLQEWLVAQPDRLAKAAKGLSKQGTKQEFKLLAHCSEKTSAAASIKQWQDIYAALGQTLNNVAVGCCGMAGTYGHEAEHRQSSQDIYELSWKEVVNDPANAGKLVATGYSCRSQVKRLDQQQLAHPVQALLAVLRAGDSA